MREIRIWDGQKYHYPEANENETNHHLQIGSNGFFSLWDGEGNFITSSEKGGIIEWSTGLTDKNGNKIFEGDICQIMRIRKYGYDKDNDPLIVGHIKFGRISVNGNDLSVYNAFHINGRSIEYLIGQELEVIGNIHESLTPNK
ncbi:YopX family protein [Elizabethkingia anophelis]|uniref:YopX family protein n=1 Tax=Elizabethkingia anophelis TaxID=1117645 RepID=UPI0023E99BA2|nr:YopX family protein [Elizabethkingia anophelis]GJN60464.1 hypothetical protein ELAK_06140 [Elizabethkingia anophelis]HDP3254008.1 hypothetical protein [Elizabethkingia anophelis]